MPFTVQAFGSNGSGQLALGHTEDISQPQECIFAHTKPTSRPAKIAAGGNHTLLLFQDGCVYAAGNNDDGRCGVDPSANLLTKFVQVEFRNATGNIVRVFKSVAATWEASIFVTPDDQIYTSGTGNFGELAQGSGVVRASQPQLVINFPPAGTKVVDIAACMRHCVVVLSDGNACGWGAARKGQLGDPRDKAVWFPRPILIPPSNKDSSVPFQAVKAVCCRDLTCIVDAPRDTSSFVVTGTDLSRKLHDGSTHRIGRWKDVAASWSGIFVLDDTVGIRAWGKDWIPSDPQSKANPHSIVAGSEHVLVETREGEILASGWGEHGNCGEPVDERGFVGNKWNQIGSGKILGAGCATSWIFHD